MRQWPVALLLLVFWTASAPGARAAGDDIAVMRLQHGDAAEVAGALQGLLAGGPREETGPPVIVVHRATNSLVIRGRESDLEQIRRLVGQFDVETRRHVFVYFAKHAMARDLATTMNAVHGRGHGRDPMGEARFIAYEPANAVIVVLGSRR